MIKFTLSFIALGLFIASILCVLGYTVQSPKTISASPAKAVISETCVVKIIYDGDTLACDINGDGRINGPEEHIRFIGIDAPEMHYSKKNKTGVDQPYALEATNFVKQETLNRPIHLEYDQDHFDKYNRRLAYIYLDPQGHTMLNEQLLKMGLAKTLFIGANRRYEPEFEELERHAQAEHLRMWQAN